MPAMYLIGIFVVFMMSIILGCSIIHSRTGNENVKVFVAIIMVIIVGVLLIWGFYLTSTPIVIK